MISEIETTTDPVLSREDAIAILNTPDEELDQLIAQAEKLRRKYKGNHVRKESSNTDRKSVV